MGSIASELTCIRARTIAIIGAGPSGLIAAKYLRAERAFDKIVLFEQRSRTGGIWNYTGDLGDEDISNVPQTNPQGKNQDPIWCDGQGSRSRSTDEARREPRFLSPIYDRLETNIPRGLMGFQDLDWPQDSQLFPKHETVLQYIQDYGKDVEDLVRYETQVVNAEPVDEKSDVGWKVQTRDVRSGAQHEEDYDAVIVANGHFIVPHIPDIPGIEEWNVQHPGSISHAKYFRNPEEFAGKKVVVVGNSASGSDISTQIAQHAQRPLLWSSKSPSMFSGPSTSPTKREYPPIKHLHASTRTVDFADGTSEPSIDAIVFATGYFYSLPFLPHLKPALITDGSHVQNTYKHLFYAPRPSLSFLARPQRVIPFPLAEAQAAVLARVYSSRLPLPPYTSMHAWEEVTFREMGGGRNFHLLPFPKDGNYINEMAAWAGTAEPRDGLEDGGEGKRPPVWGKWEFWCREQFPRIRAAFVALGDERGAVRRVEELGFRFGDTKRE